MQSKVKYYLQTAGLRNLTVCNGLLLSSMSLMLAVPANANSCMTLIWLYPNRMAVTFWRPANENFWSDSSGVCWMDSSRSRLSPRNANRSTRRMQLVSNVSFRKCRRPVKASVGRYVRLFLVIDRCSTVLGRSLSGTNVRCPELQSI